MHQSTGVDNLSIELPRPHEGQQSVLTEAKRFNCLTCGRQWGKTSLGKELAIRYAMHKKPVGWFSPSYKSLDEAFEDIKTTTEPLWNHKAGSKDEQQKQLRFPGGGKIEFWSLEDPDAPRGRKYARLIVDEAAMVKNLKDVWEKSLRALIAYYRGDAWFLSTPRGIANDFYTFYQWGQDPEKPNWASWRRPSWTNPFLAAEEIEEIRESLSELSFAQEYAAEFVSFTGTVFVNIDRAVQNTTVQRTNKNVVAVDWAGSKGRGDYTVFEAVDTGGELIGIERFRGLTYNDQRNRLKSFADRYAAIVILAEENNMGAPLIEQLNADGIDVKPFITTNATKQAAIETLALAFERQQIKIPDNPVLLGELQAFEGKQTPAGLIRYAAAGNGHDDTVIPLAMAWQYVNQPQSHGGLFESWRRKSEAASAQPEMSAQRSPVIYAPAVSALAAQGANQKQAIEGWRMPRKQAPVRHQQVICGSCGSVPASYGATWRCNCGTTGSMN